ncbi:MAG TPA: DUF4153 domain-containing protein, partial [Sphingomonadaceae bacterium]|nr:DUF4153 domain-containing protein [Sphingomonadaceae bacterium]
MDERIEGERWPLRAWGLAVLGAGLAAAIHLLLRDGPAPSGRLALATLLGVGGVVFGFMVERSRAAGAAVFALVAGLVVASVIFWNGGPGNWNASDGWRIACAALAVVIAAPLFQAARREGRWRL